MKKNLDIIIANPAGNITIFVKTPTDQKDYKKIATQLLAHKEFNGEQIAFIVDDGVQSHQPKMNMAGMEFCVNASRSFALLLAKQHPLLYKDEFTINVSGSTLPITVSTDMQTNNVQIMIPPHITTNNFTYKNYQLFQANFEGICHLVTFDIPFSSEIFESIKNAFYKKNNAPALGIMFVDKNKSNLIPAVFVQNINSTIIEGSCGSGTIATAVALCQAMTDCSQRFEIQQPAGTLNVSITKVNNKITTILLDGLVSFSQPLQVQVEL
ncbi:MAG: hypothetical protein ACRC5H_01430 [Treponemataceae bacterium]